MDATLQIPNAEKMNSFLNQAEKDLIEKILKNNGPEVEDYEMIMELLDRINEDYQIQFFRDFLKNNMNRTTLFAHSYEKPRGYAGDFEIISKIYSNFVSANPQDVKWDLFFHWTPATQAVRNRKIFLDTTIKAASEKVNNVLILGCGPSQDINYYLTQNEDPDIHFDLVDIDEDAIYFSAATNQKFKSQLSFKKANVLKFNADRKYDLIYASGLFDYFGDRLFAIMLRRMIKWVNPGGRIVIGNFCISNPSKSVLEVMTDWFLHHRSENDLIQIAETALGNELPIYVLKEPTGINLFLTIENGQR